MKKHKHTTRDTNRNAHHICSSSIRPIWNCSSSVISSEICDKASVVSFHKIVARWSCHHPSGLWQHSDPFNSRIQDLHDNDTSMTKRGKKWRGRGRELTKGQSTYLFCKKLTFQIASREERRINSKLAPHKTPRGSIITLLLLFFLLHLLLLLLYPDPLLLLHRTHRNNDLAHSTPNKKFKIHSQCTWPIKRSAFNHDVIPKGSLGLPEFKNWEAYWRLLLVLLPQPWNP